MRRRKLFLVEAPCACIRYSKTRTTNVLETNNPIKALWSFFRYPETALSIVLKTYHKTSTKTIFTILAKDTYRIANKE